MSFQDTDSRIDKRFYKQLGSLLSGTATALWKKGDRPPAATQTKHLPQPDMTTQRGSNTIILFIFFLFSLVLLNQTFKVLASTPSKLTNDFVKFCGCSYMKSFSFVGSLMLFTVNLCCLSVVLFTTKSCESKPHH